MRRSSGFTLIEIAIVLSVAAILAVAGTVGYRAATRNAKLSGAANELAVRMAGLKSRAMSEGADVLLVFADAPGGDGTACGLASSAGCARYFVLQRPAAAWALADFDPDHPAAGAELVTEQLLPRGAHLSYPDVAPIMDAPFSGVMLHDDELTTTCAGDRKCFAIRYTARGDVRPEFVSGTPYPKAGYAFVLGGDPATASGADPRRGILVSFPAGILRTFVF